MARTPSVDDISKGEVGAGPVVEEDDGGGAIPSDAHTDAAMREKPDAACRM